MIRRIALGKGSFPMLCFALSGLGIVAFLVIFYLDAQANAARLLSLRAGPPPAVAIENFERDPQDGLAREVQVTGQLDTSLAHRAAVTRHGLREQSVIIPITNDAAAQTSTHVIFGYVIVPLELGESDAEALRRVNLDVSGAGPIGPIVNINGQSVENIGLAARMSSWLTAADRAVSPEPLLIVPFPGSREAGLAPLPASPYRRLSLWFSAAFALAGLHLFALAGRKEPGPVVENHAQSNAPPPSLHSLKAAKRFAPLIEQDALYRTGDKAVAHDRSSPIA